MLEPDEATRLLLVEGHTRLRVELARALERAGFEVEARDQAPGLGGDEGFALRLIDVEAPGVATWLASRPFVAPTILLTSDVTSRRPDVHAESGPLERLAKPFSLPALEGCILAQLGEVRSPGREPGDPILRTDHPPLHHTLERARRLARRGVPTTLVGELGSGRLALARQMHLWSRRAAEPLVVLDRARLERGGAAGAVAAVAAAVERAGAGSLVVVDPADQTPTVQDALLGALRETEEGGPGWLCVAPRSLEDGVAAGELALELQYRLEAARLILPPFRERAADHAALCRAWARRVARELGQTAPAVDSALIELLSRDGFPGNRFGLESRLRAFLIQSDGQSERLESLASRDAHAAEAAPSLHLKTLERDTIVRALAHWSGNRTRASESLGISVRTLRNKIREYGLR